MKTRIPTFEEVSFNNSRDKNKFYLNPDEYDISNVNKIADLIGAHQKYIHSVPYDKIKGYTYTELRMVMEMYGLYTFPTTELVNWLNDQIDEYYEGCEPAIEIGAGTGWIGRELEIPSTDPKYQQTLFKNYYAGQGIKIIDYPDFIIELTAEEAIKHYHPEYVIGSFITPKFGIHGNNKVGSVVGPDTLWIVNHCHKYFLIGNQNIHRHDPIMKRKHKEYSFPWLITRGDITKSRIFVWENKLWKP